MDIAWTRQPGNQITLFSFQPTTAQRCRSATEKFTSILDLLSSVLSIFLKKISPLWKSEI